MEKVASCSVYGLLLYCIFRSYANVPASGEAHGALATESRASSELVQFENEQDAVRKEFLSGFK